MTGALILILVVVGILAIAATKTDYLEATATTEISAPPETVFALLNDFRHWPAWAPQDRMDATMQRSFSGFPSGKGALSEWRSDGKAGCGRMEITEAVAPTTVVVQVDFIKPFVTRNVHTFTLAPPDGGGTTVVWAMRGQKPFIGKIVCVFYNLNRMLEKHLVDGLKALKTLAEKGLEAGAVK